jgi:hypothetical protein
MPRYDAIVLGSGQAGDPLAQKLPDHGWSVALVDKEHLGGTCVNTGVPGRPHCCSRDPFWPLLKAGIPARP